MADTKKITRAEYMLLVMAMAQMLAGPGKTPTAAQIMIAQNKIKGDLEHKGVTVLGGMTDADLQFTKVKGVLSGRASYVGGCDSSGDKIGSFWRKLKSVAKTTAKHARNLAPYALPLIPAAVATPFALKAIQAARARKAAAPAAEAPAAEAEAPAAEAPSEESLESLLGIGGNQRESEIISGDAGYMGAAEESAMPRRRGRRRRRKSAVVGNAIPHDLYRAAVMQKAAQLSGGRFGTKAIFAAQKKVQGRLAANGLRVAIPGARPSRRTF